MHIAILAGEQSGDELGAELIKSLRKLNPAIRFDGVGGSKMKELGFHSLLPMSDFSVMGISEIIKSLPKLIKFRRYLYEHYQTTMPDAFIGIDYPDFNLGLERRLKDLGIYTVHYVSPSVWAWRESRIHSIKASCDLMLTLFNFEKKFYEQHNMQAIYCGHPLIDKIPANASTEIARSNLRLDIFPEQRLLAILPGSRTNEIKMLLPIFIEVALKLLQKNPNIKFIIPTHSECLARPIREILQETELSTQIVIDQSQEVMLAADAILLASGTATLEAMLLNKPMLVAYKLSAVTAFIAKKLIQTTHFSLPNLLADEPLVPEYIQEDINTDDMADKLNELLFSENKRNKVITRFKAIRKNMKSNGSNTAAEAIYSAIIQSGLNL